MKEKILKTAIQVLREGGIKKLSQPEICSVLGIRQSQLTYYFPRRQDLIKAIVAEFSETARDRLNRLSSDADITTIINELEMQITKPGPIRGFLGLLIEGDQEPVVAKIMLEHMREFEAALSLRLEKLLRPEEVRFLLEHLRGIGISRFVNPDYDSKKSMKMLCQLFSDQSPKKGNKK